jgi:hypothetical protein
VDAHSAPQEPEPHGGSADNFRTLLGEAMRFWEPRRLVYNLTLLAVVVTWVWASWPHFRPAFTPSSLLAFAVLGLLANVCYSAAYLVDIPLLLSRFRTGWKRRRWILWVAGTVLAFVLANYWIADEIYLYV